VRQSRKHRRASGIYKLEPLFRNEKCELVAKGEHTYYIDGRIGEYAIVSVPETTSRASALALERGLSELAKKPVLIVTHNMTFMRATLLSREERTELAAAVAEAKAAVKDGGQDAGAAAQQ